MKKIVLACFLVCLVNASSTTIQNKETTKVEKTIHTSNNSTENFSNEFDDEFSEDFSNEFEKKEKKEIFDPLSGYNRVMTTFNDKTYTYVLEPVANAYSKILPQTVRNGISNFFDNIAFPVNFANNLLQLKFKNAGDELVRFVVNTIWGLGGFMDSADEYLGIKAHEEDFGQTLGYWGVGEGFPIVLPLLGPSNLRDTVSRVADFYLMPTDNTGKNALKYKISHNWYTTLGYTVVDSTNDISLRLGQYESIKKDALDLYPFLRDIYSQRRKQQIKE